MSVIQGASVGGGSLRHGARTTTASRRGRQAGGLEAGVHRNGELGGLGGHAARSHERGAAGRIDLLPSALASAVPGNRRDVSSARHGSDSGARASDDLRMTGRAPGGSSWRLDGFKLIQDDHHLEMWADTTTLFMTIAREAGGRGQTISKGIIRILPADFLKQMTTMAVTGTNNPIERLKAPAAFGKFFAGGIFDTCGGVFQRPNDLKPDAGPRERRRSASRCQSCLVNGCLVPLSVQRQVANVHG